MKKHKKGKAMTAKHMPNGIKGGGGLCNMSPGKPKYGKRVKNADEPRGMGGS